MTSQIECSPTRDSVLRSRGLEMNLRTRQVTLHGATVTLTPSEFRLLQILMLNVDRVCPLSLLRAAVGSKNTVRSGIGRLRRKLDDHHHVLIRTAHGQGYLIIGRAR